MLFPLHGALGHTDGTSGADDAAEVATYAFSAYQTRTAGFGIERDGLMTSIVARNLAAPTAYALLWIELGIDDGVTVELSWSPERRQLFANQLLQLYVMDNCSNSKREVLRMKHLSYMVEF